MSEDGAQPRGLRLGWDLLIWTATSILALLAVTTRAGLGFPLALVFASCSGVVLLREERQPLRRPGTLLCLLLFTGFVVSDLIGSSVRPAAAPSLRWAAPALALLAVSGATLAAIRMRRVGSLQPRLVLIMAAVAVTPPALQAHLSTLRLGETLTQEAFYRLSGGVSEAHERVASFIRYSEDSIRTQAQLPGVRRHLGVDPSARARSEAETTAILRSILTQDAANITSVGLHDTEGLDLLDTDSARIGARSEGRWIDDALRTGLPCISEVEGGRFRVAQVVRDEDGRALGLLRVEYSATLLQRFAQRSEGSFGPGSYLVIVDREDQILAHGRAPERVGARAGPGDLDLRELERLRARGRDEGIEVRAGPVRAAQPLERPAWLLVSVQPAIYFSATIEDHVRLATYFALALTLLGLGSALWLAQRMTAPLQAISASIRRLSDRDFDTPVADGGLDELAELSVAFDKLRVDLRETLAGLESRTRDLEATNHILEAEMRERSGAESREAALEAELRQHQKLDALGRLAGGVAHDLNNMLLPITGFAELAKDELEDPEAVEEYLDEVVAAGWRASELVGQLLAFSRKQVSEVRPLDLGAQLRGLERMLRASVPERIALTLTLCEGAIVRLDATQLQQIVLNLVVNARDAIEGSGAIEVRLTRSEATPGERARVHLRVRDDGSGMPPEVRAKIFEPFYSTKARGEGTGLGLATVYGIVTQHGGEISVESAPGEGTCFELSWPASSGVEASGLMPIVGLGRDRKLAGTVVLVVEDQEAVRGLVAQVLRRAGCEVLTASEGDEAEQLWAAQPRPPELLITDVILPGRSGPELYAHLLERAPELRVLYTSGYTNELSEQLSEPGPREAFLAKPFAVARLLEAVAQLLAR